MAAQRDDLLQMRTEKLVYRYADFLFVSCQLPGNLWAQNRNELRQNVFWQTLTFHRNACAHLTSDVVDLQILLRSLVNVLGVFGCNLRRDAKAIKIALRSANDRRDTILCPRRDIRDVTGVQFDDGSLFDEIHPADFADWFVAVSSVAVQRHVIQRIFATVGTRNHEWIWSMASRRQEEKYVRGMQFDRWMMPLRRRILDDYSRPIVLRAAENRHLSRDVEFQGGILVVIAI